MIGPVTLWWMGFGYWAGAPMRAFMPPHMLETFRAGAEMRHRLVIDAFYGPRQSYGGARQCNCSRCRRWR